MSISKSSNYERLAKELAYLVNHKSSLVLAIRILTGDCYSPYKDQQPDLVIGVKQSTGTVHEAVLCQPDSYITESLIPILQIQLDIYNTRINEIESLIKSVDKLLENK